MPFKTFALQFAFLYAPFVHSSMEQVTPFLYRGHDPKLNEIYSLHDKGIKTIISLRTNPQPRKKALCEKLGMHWIVINTGVFLVPTEKQIDEFRTIVNNPANRPVYTACELDMDRTSVFIEAYRMVDQGWNVQQMEKDLHAHHPKVWWPTFRKYPGAIINYTEKHKAVHQDTGNG